jgi:uncharacterized protein
MIGVLAAAIRDAAPLAVAVSGGVDSVSLASLAHGLLGADGMLAVHAVSPAVPSEATARVRARALADGWNLKIIEAGEFSDPAYLANPVNRCFFCKTNLYGAIASVTGRQIVSGANVSDLGEYRPGLDAAREHGVRHPFVEAGYEKAAVRDLASALGLDEVAELPSAPCLSSRIETGIRIDPEVLLFVDRAEQRVRMALGYGGPARAVRCRVRAAGVVIELDPDSLCELDNRSRAMLRDQLTMSTPASLVGRAIVFEPYRNGSAFLRTRA